MKSLIRNIRILSNLSGGRLYYAFRRANKARSEEVWMPVAEGSLSVSMYPNKY